MPVMYNAFLLCPVTVTYAAPCVLDYLRISTRPTMSCIAQALDSLELNQTVYHGHYKHR
jgi:hypothetical protein